MPPRWGVIVLLGLAAPARADHAPKRGPSSSTVKRDVKKHDFDITKVKSVGKGAIHLDDDSEAYVWTGDVSFAAKSSRYLLALDGSCRASYHWSKRWTFDGCVVSWQSFHGVKPPSDDQLSAAMANPDWTSASGGDTALGEPPPIYTRGARWSFVDPMTADFPYAIDYWHVSIVDPRQRVHATRAMSVRFTRATVDATTWTLAGFVWGDPTDGEAGLLPADQQGADAPTVAMMERRERFEQLYAAWKVPSLDSDRALAGFAFEVLYAARSPIEWEAFMDRWWPDTGDYHDGKFAWGNQAVELDRQITSGVLGARAQEFHANYCPTAAIASSTAGEDGETVFVFANRAGTVGACSITVSSKLASKAGTRSITDIACDPATGAETLSCK